MASYEVTMPRETGRGERVGYTLYFAGQNVVYTLIQSYLIVFYVTLLKLDPALVATVFLIVRVWDAMTFLGLRTMTLVVTSLLRPMFTADCVEYGEHKTGVRSESVPFAVQTFFNKTGDALGTALGGFVMAAVMYLGPKRFYKLDEESVKKMIAENARRAEETA